MSKDHSRSTKSKSARQEPSLFERLERSLTQALQHAKGELRLNETHLSLESNVDFQAVEIMQIRETASHRKQGNSL